DVARVAHPLMFLRTFVSRISTYSIHTQSHPPGTPLLLHALRRIGLGGPLPAAILYIGAGASAVPAAAVAARQTGVSTAFIPALALAPAAFTIGTSADALYLGVAAWAVALCVGSRTSRLAAG